MPFKQKFIFTFSIIAIIGLVISGCGKKSNEKTSGDKLNVVTTIGMINDVALNIGGDKVNVIGLMGPGVDPHLYKASAGDVQRMQSADLILYNGLHLEGAMTDLFDKLRGTNKTVAVTESIPEDLLLKPQAFEGAHDPHVWFDVSLWMKAAERIRDALIEKDPANADIYRVNAEQYIDRLDSLHQYARTMASSLPEHNRVLITAHDAFNYFGRAYGFTVKGLQGISTVTEAGTADMQSLAKYIADNKVPAIFIESSVPRRSIEALQAAVEARGFEVKIGGELFSDAMGDPGAFEGTYLGMVSHNINTIVSALSGSGGH